MPNEPNAIAIRFSDKFERKLYTLSKKYRKLRSDVQPILEQLLAGNFMGDRLPGIGADYQVFKVRIKNSDIQKGKSAGYRLIYQLESSTSILLLYIYSKSDQEDIAPAEIRSILAEFYEDKE